MPWEKQRNGTRTFIVRTCINGVKTAHKKGPGERGRLAEQEVLRERLAKRQARVDELELHALFRQYEKLVRAALDEALIPYGYEKRYYGRWAISSLCGRKERKSSNEQT